MSHRVIAFEIICFKTLYSSNGLIMILKKNNAKRLF